MDQIHPKLSNVFRAQKKNQIFCPFLHWCGFRHSPFSAFFFLWKILPHSSWSHCLIWISLQEKSRNFVLPPSSAIWLQLYLFAEIQVWSQRPKLPTQHLFHGLRKAWGEKNKKAIKDNFQNEQNEKTLKCSAPATKDFNKHSELVPVLLRLYLSKSTKCQSGFSLLEAGAQISMETRRRWRCLWRGFLQRFPSSQFTFAGDFIATLVLEKIKNKCFIFLGLQILMLFPLLPSPSCSLSQWILWFCLFTATLEKIKLLM